MTRTPIPAAKLPAAGAPTDAPLSARPYLALHRLANSEPDWVEAARDLRPARHRIVPQESRLVMFFRDNGEDVTTYFAIFAAASALAVVLAGYWGALS